MKLEQFIAIFPDEPRQINRTASDREGGVKWVWRVNLRYAGCGMYAENESLEQALAMVAHQRLESLGRRVKVEQESQRHAELAFSELQSRIVKVLHS